MNADLTINKPWKVLLKYTLPLLGGAIFQQLYTLADTIIAGRFAGQAALTAIGASNAIVNILMAFALGANAGCAVLAARYFGKKDNADVKTTIYTALIAFAVFSIVLMGAGVVTCRLTLDALKTPQEAMNESVTYLNIYYYGLPFLMLYNLGTGIFSALGDSKTPFLFLVFSSVTNIVLDYFMVQPWGVAGVAWATFIAQGCAGVLAFLLLLRRVRSFDTGGHFLLFSPEMLRRLTNYAIPSIAQQSFVSVGNVIIQYYVNLCGATVIAGFSAATKVNMFALTCCMSFASGLSSYVAQNIGARKLDRIGPGLKAGATFAIALAVIFMAVYLLFADFLISLFIPAGSSSGVIDVGRQYLFVVTPFYIIVCIKFVCDSVLRGAGAMRPFMITTFSDLIIRVVLSIVLFHVWRELGIWLSWPIGWFLGSGLSVWFYKTGAWRKNLPVL